jgi:tRNA A-37 threonylcarbamoyl transferase component Bud32
MEMASVVHEIKRFLQQLERLEPLAVSQVPYRTAESLEELELMVERMSAHDEDGRAMTTHVLHRLLDVHAQLEAWALTQQQQPKRRPSLFRICGMSSGTLMGDATLERAETSAQADDELKQAIASFRETLERFYAHVDTALQAVSAHYDDAMLELMCESRTKGADEHFGFHTEIDRLLRRHLIVRHDGIVSAVHDWRPQWERQRSRQVERAKRRLQTMLLCPQHCGAGDHAVITSCHGCDDDQSSTLEVSPTGVGTRQALAALSAVLGMPDWFTPPQEVMFDSHQSFSEGAFGSVHHGWWLDARVVIKKIKATTAITLDNIQGESQDATFRREVGIWHSLRHPHVVSLFGACYTSHERFFVCEDAAQGQLSDYLKDVAARKGSIARVVTAWEKLLEAARGLQYLHARGVLHQDLKCDNILVGSDGRAKLTDFGLSASVLRGHQRHFSQLVKTVGAPRWKAPEVLRHEPPTMESDVFSLAMCVVEAVTGAFPWGNSQPDAAVAFHVKRGRPLEVGKECFSAGEWAMVQEMSRTDPARRLPLEGVVQALDAVARKHRAVVSWT